MTAPARVAVFRADAGPDLGGGHVMRCLCLARTLADAGWRFRFAGDPLTLATVPELAGHGFITLTDPGREAEDMAAALPDGIDLLVVDHYRRGAGDEARCRPWARRILVLDDLADRRHDCDLLLDQTFGRRPADYAGLVPDGARLLLGADHALLRPPFAAARPRALARRAQDGPVRRILVSFGATDPAGANAVALEALARAGFDGPVDVAVGSASPHLDRLRTLVAASGGPAVTLHVDHADMAELMSAADLSIGAGGSTSWERCCLGLPSIVVVLVANQERIASNLHDAGAILNVGGLGDDLPDRLSAAVARLVTDGRSRHAMAKAAAAICDGLGATRVVQAVST